MLPAIDGVRKAWRVAGMAGMAGKTALTATAARRCQGRGGADDRGACHARAIIDVGPMRLTEELLARCILVLLDTASATTNCSLYDDGAPARVPYMSLYEV
jgi:hypothetical protein